MGQALKKDENKGRYCKFVKHEDGSYTLEPVKVPAHVKKERAERIRRREIQIHVKNNRERAAAINGGFLIFMSVALVCFVLICVFYLALQNRVTNQLSENTSLQAQISELQEDNDALEKQLSASEDLSEIESVASDRLGMVNVDRDQIIYYSMDASDYMLQYQYMNQD